MLDASPLNEAEAFIVPVAALPPDTVVPSEVVVPYSNFGVVDVEPAEIVPLSVADVDPIAVGLFVLIEMEPTDDATLLSVQPPAGLTPKSSLAFCSSKSAAITSSS